MLFQYNKFTDEESKVHGNCPAYDYRGGLNFPWFNLM